jgi:RIO-like serine/threonine protein kinase
MDKVNGITLAEYQRGLHTLSEKAEIINSLIGAVSKLHAAGYVHGDLNSENIMVDENNRIKLIDFDRYDTISNCEKLNLDRCYLKCHIASMIFNTTYDMINIIKSFPDYRMEDIIDYHSNTMMGDKIYKKFRSIPYMLP